MYEQKSAKQANQIKGVGKEPVKEQVKTTKSLKLNISNNNSQMHNIEVTPTNANIENLDNKFQPSYSGIEMPIGKEVGDETINNINQPLYEQQMLKNERIRARIPPP